MNMQRPELEKIVKEHDASRESSYWTEFYAHNDFSRGSSFFEFIESQPFTPSNIIDIGCGDGRDSFAFAQKGKNVVGLDRSPVGVSHASEKATKAGLDQDVTFAVCDVSDVDEVRRIIDVVRGSTKNEPVCFYMRFFLHSIPEDVQNGLLKIISESAQPGDVFAAEFRTDKDEERAKAFGTDHYRRYQNAETFSTALHEQHGWHLVSELESDGLSPYQGEDPILYRVIAQYPS